MVGKFIQNNRGGIMKEQDFKVVEKFSNPIDAEFLKHRLENAGIEATVSHIDSSSFVLEVGNINVIRVWVSNADFERAKEIIETDPESLVDED